MENQEVLPKVIILGMDGLDPNILGEFIEQGELPNFKKLIENGSFKELGTSYPPQSPVAWSNFITGNNPGKHGIYDFIHRDPDNYAPYLSSSKIIEGRWIINLKKWQIPLIPSRIKLLRKAKPFWYYLEKKGIPAYIIKIPSTFPPDAKDTRIISGLGTPDVKGTNGEFSLYTDTLHTDLMSVEGGNIYRVSILDNSLTSYIYGPINPLKKNGELLKVKFHVDLAKDSNAVLIRVGREEIFLQEGQWSGWIPLKFKVLQPFYSISSICRFYLKEIKPHFKLYMSPLNIDPLKPSMPISTPRNFSKTLYKKIGYFYTQGLPTDSKALTSGIFNRTDYLKQEALVWKERKKLFDLMQREFKGGVLFFYFTTTDMNQHLFYSSMDPEHPAYSKELNERYGHVILETYKRMDLILGIILRDINENILLLVLSDHGFAPFYRSFNINTWLYKKGYLKVIDERRIGYSEMLQNIDWTKTKAYSLGFNSIYINLKDREFHGIVNEEDKDSLLKLLVRELEETVDPENGFYPVYRAYLRDEIYKGEYIDMAPEICVGYSRGYRTSWQSAIGILTQEVFSFNKDIWSGTHLISPELIPGILLSNREIRIEEPDLRDLPVTVLKEFGILCNMEGRDLFKRE